MGQDSNNSHRRYDGLGAHLRPVAGPSRPEPTQKGQGATVTTAPASAQPSATAQPMPKLPSGSGKK